MHNVHVVAVAAIIDTHEVGHGHDVYGDREDNCTVVFCRNTAQSLHISVLQRK